MAVNRPEWSLWVQLGLRAVSAALLIVCLSYSIYCSVAFGEDLVPVYAVAPLVLILHVSVLARLCTSIFGGASAPGRASTGFIAVADVIAIPVALSAIFVMILSQGRKECGAGDCDEARADPAEQPRAVAVFLLCAVSGITFLSAVDGFVWCCTSRKPSYRLQ